MELEQKAVELIEQLQALAQPAADLAIATVQAAAIISMVQAVVAIPMIYGLARLSKLLFKKGEETHCDTEMAYWLSGVISAIGAVLLTIAAFCVLFDTGNWLALFSPEMALAYKLIG